MSDKNFVNKYLNEFSSLLKPNDEIINKIINVKSILIEAKANNKKIMIFGNGGSAAIASHFSVDITKNANIRCVNYNEADLITCFSNDFGYQNWVKKSLEYFADPEDLLILISCSGNSKNLVNARKKAVSMKLKTAVITGCKKFNKLNKEKNDVNIWINSNSYNQIEIIHHIILLLIVDDIINLKKN